MSRQWIMVIAREEEIPSWGNLAERHGNEMGSCITGKTLREIHAAWATSKGIHFEG